MDGVSIAVVISLVVIVYFVPTVIALLRGHRQAVAIGALNMLLGWTFLGWVGSLIWSLTSPSAPPQITVYAGGSTSNGL